MSRLLMMNLVSTDVIHSWTIPSLGVKVDANPGHSLLHKMCFTCVLPVLLFMTEFTLYKDKKIFDKLIRYLKLLWETKDISRVNEGNMGFY